MKMKSFLKSSFIVSLLMSGTTYNLQSAESFNYGSDSSKNFDSRHDTLNNDFKSDSSPQRFENDNDSTRSSVNDNDSSQNRPNPAPTTPQRRIQK